MEQSAFARSRAALPSTARLSIDRLVHGEDWYMSYICLQGDQVSLHIWAYEIPLLRVQSVDSQSMSVPVLGFYIIGAATRSNLS